MSTSSSSEIELDVDVGGTDSVPTKQHSCKLFEGIDRLQLKLLDCKTDICNAFSISLLDFDKLTVEQLKGNKIKKEKLCQFFVDVIEAGVSGCEA